jgi:exodeoxyribonuclease VII large subunit
MLFPSVLQGEKAAASMIYQLNRIEKLIHHFDAVAIIRGGGGDVGLTCYNNYELSKKIAKYPIPVLTGIGHSTNETVAELVAFKNAITPTELADFLLQQFHNFSVPVQEAENLLIDKSRRILTEQKLKLSNSAKYFRSVTSSMLLKNRHNILSAFKSIGQSAISRLKQDKQTIRQSVKDMERSCRQGFLSGRKDLTSLRSSLVSKTQILLKNKKLGIENMEKQVDIMSPARVLKRGYSITIVNGKALKNTEDIKSGDTIHTILENGTIDSTVTTTNKQQEA